MTEASDELHKNSGAASLQFLRSQLQNKDLLLVLLPGGSNDNFLQFFMPACNRKCNSFPRI